MGNIILDSGTQIITKDSTGSKGVPLDARGMVNYYEDIKDLPMPYIPMKVIVNNDSLNGEHQKGEYVVTKLTDLGDVDETAIIPIKDYIPETDPTVPAHVKAITQQNITDWNGKQDAITPTNTLSPNSIKDIDMSGKIAAYNNSGVLGSSGIDTANIAVKSEMSIADGTGANAGTATIQLKSGTSKKVLTQHQSLDGKVDKISGKGLSTNDYDNTEKGKVANAIQMPSGATTDKVLGYANNAVAWVEKPSNGKSAYEMWYEENEYDDPTTYNEDYFLASLKAQFGEYTTADYGTDGMPNDGTNDIAAADANHNKIYIVPNAASSSTSNVMWVSVSDGNNGYMWVSLGEVNVSGKFASNQELKNVNIVQDLNTGGAGNVPSAAAVKELNDNFNVKLAGVTASETKVIQQPIQGSYVKGTDGTIVSSNDTAYLEIALGDAKSVRFLGGWFTSSSYTSGYAFGHYTDPSDPTTWVTDKSSVFDTNASALGVKEYVIAVPEGATHFRTTTATGSVPALAQNFYCYLQSGENVIDKIGKLEEKIYGEKILTLGNNIVSNLSKYLFKIGVANSSDTSKTAIERTAGSYGQTLVLNVENYHAESLRILLKPQRSRISYVMFAKKLPDISTKNSYSLQELIEGKYLSQVHNTTNGWVSCFQYSTETYINIPDDAKYIFFAILIIGISQGKTPDSIKIEYVSYDGGDLNILSERTNIIEKSIEGRKNSQGVVFYNGTFDADGVLQSSSKYAYSSPISYSKPFYVELHDGYELYRVRLFNAKDELININERVYTTSSHHTVWGLAPAFPQYYVRLEVRRTDGEDIDVNKNIVKRFYNFEGYKKVIPNGIPAECWKIFQSRVMQIINPTWFALNNVVQNSTGNNLNSYFFLKDTVNRGIPYSEAAKYSKYVGNNVSLRTFLTSLLNKRSVMYTEDIEPTRNKSSYGIDYAGCLGHYSSAYYGTVCTGLTSYLVGTLGVIKSNAWVGRSNMKSVATGTGDANGVVYQVRSMDDTTWTTVQSIDDVIAIIQPGDIVKTTGHCFAISNVYLDDIEQIKFVFVAEQTTPRGCITPYPVDKFKDRLLGLVSASSNYRNFVICRQTAQQWQDRLTRLGNFEDSFPYIQMDRDDYTPQSLSIDPDITTFAGEYVAFPTNSAASTNNNYKAFLNVHRGGANGYTKLQIFFEDDNIATATPVEYSLADENAWIGESVKSNNVLIYPDDAADKDDWVIFDLKKITTLLTAGKYKARVSNADGTKLSGFTHFEMVDINITPDNYVEGQVPASFSFSCSDNATPYMIAWEGTNGLATKAPFEIPSDNVIWDETTHTGVVTTPSTVPAFVKLYVRGEYGDIVMRTPTNGTDADEDWDDPE